MSVSDSQADADNHIEDLEIQVTDSAEEILFQTVQPKNTAGRKYHVEYDIIVPHSLEVMATQDNGKIEILYIENSVDVSNMNGDVLLSNIAGGVMAVVDNGSIEGTVFLPVGKTIDLSTNNGNLELKHPHIHILGIFCYRCKWSNTCNRSGFHRCCEHQDKGKTG